MASQDLTLIIKAQNLSSAAFEQTKAGLQAVGQQVAKLPPVTDEWSNSMQRAAQKMERMHEEAMKMNTGFKSSSDQAQQFAQTLGQVSSTATASAAALGLPIGPLTTLNATLPLASLGFKQLTTSAVAFNAAALGVVGAGLAVGAAIGSWLNSFPAVTDAVDKLTFALFGAEKQAKVSAVEQKKRNAEANKDLEERINKEIALMRARGMTSEQIRKTFQVEKVGREAALEDLDQTIVAEGKRAEANKKAAAEAMKNAKEEGDFRAAQMKRVYEQIAFFQKAEQAIFLASAKEQKQIRDEAEKQAADYGKRQLQRLKDEAAAKKKALEDYWDEQERQFEAEKVRLEEDAQLWANVADAISVAGDAFILFGADADSVLVKLADGLAGLAATASTVFGKLASGDVFGAVTSGLGGVINFIGGLFGGSDKAREEMEKLYAEFMRSVGGIENLQAAADEAGISLQALFDAKKAEELEAAIVDINRQLALWEDATDKTREAMERYGITIDQMGERFAQQELDKMFGDLYQDYQLLIAAGADVALVNEKMADAINKYIQDSIKAGTEIPIAMKPILQSLIDQGLLTDAAGNKLTDLSGIEFSESITVGIDRITDAIMLLVEALYRGLGITREFGDALMDLKYKDIPGYGGNPPPPLKAEGGWFPFRSGGYPVTVGESGNEAIIPEEKLAGIVARAVAMAGGSNMGGGNLVVHSKVHIDGREIGKASSKAERRRQLRRHPNGEHTGRW